MKYFPTVLSLALLVIVTILIGCNSEQPTDILNTNSPIDSTGALSGGAENRFGSGATGLVDPCVRNDRFGFRC